MPTPPLTDDKAMAAAIAYRAANDNKSEAARTLGLPRNTFCNHLKRAAERGLLGPARNVAGGMRSGKSLTRQPASMSNNVKRRARNGSQPTGW